MSVPLKAWRTEGPTADEQRFTPHAGWGWRAWNGMSPEQAFCDFAGSLARMLQPSLVIETGVGQGYTTRRIAKALGTLGSPASLVCFEHDEELRARLADLPFFMSGQAILSQQPTPDKNQLTQATLTILDSEPPWRYQEIEGWADHAQPGSVLLCHDAANGHGAGTIHAEVRRRCEAYTRGVLLGNPRGGWLAIR